MGEHGRVRRWVRIFKPDAHSEVKEELEFHLEQRTRANIARGMSPEAARAAAQTRLGDVSAVRDECAELLTAERRATARRIWLNVSWLDIKLGLRMLVKYPGLTLIGGLGIALAIAIGSGYTVFLNAMLDRTIPLPHGDRLVVLQNWDTRTNSKNTQLLHDFVAWRAGLRTVQDVSAFRAVSRNLISGDGSSEPLTIAEMSASGFRVAGVRPLMGRYLVEDDERTGAAPVILIGYDVWQRRFAGDARIIGRALRFGSTMHTVVGVMPEGYAFPVNHDLWMPFRADPASVARGAGPSITVFGRLVPGATLAEARAEIQVFGQNAAVAFPDTHARLLARAQPYTYGFTGMDNPGNVSGARAARLLFIVLMLVICVNVAALVYARTAVRRGEILVRTALGASRARVVGQLFAETLVLALAAATVGLAVVAVALQQARQFLGAFFGGQLPFWFHLRLSLGSVLFAVLLAVLAAVITGVLPALKATGRRLQISLQQLSSGGSEMLLGKTWTLLIVGQVAFAVALLPAAVYQGAEMIRYGTVDAGYADDEYLATLVQMERDWDADAASSEASASRFEALYSSRIEELMRRLRNESSVAAVSYASSVPGSEPGGVVVAENNSTSNEAMSSRYVRFARVDVGFFQAFDIPLLSGRAFTPADAGSAASAVIVNESFVRRMFVDGSALGRRFRQVEDGQPAQRWFEIVGVVPDFPNAMMPEQVEARVYQAAPAGALYPAVLAVRLRDGSPAAFGPQLRKITSGLDPSLQLQRMRTLEAVNHQNQSALRLIGLGIALATLSVLLLSAAGIYALMSLAVARRRREIGIRAALGANPRRILASVFARAAAQITLGIGVGLVAFLAVFKVSGGHLSELLPILAVVAAIIFTVGTLASIGPARRGLRIQPTEALRHE